MKRMKQLVCALTIALTAFAVPASGEPADNIEARAGDLKIIHLWTTKPDAFLDAWRQPTPPNLSVSSKTQRNVPVQQFILYANCTPDSEGNCQLAAQIEITAPDGTPYGETMQFAALPATPAGPRDRIMLAPTSIGLRIEDGEQLGTYRIVLRVTDENSKLTAESRVSIEVVEAQPDSGQVPGS